MAPLRLLVVEGNVRAARERHRATYGLTPSESYAAVLRRFVPEAVCDVAFPADEGANLPDSAGLADYDGVVITGSALNVWKAEPESMRQVELAREVYRSGTPFFGSCWGLQVATVAAGGSVRANPRGREVAIARDIRLTEAGVAHPLYQGKAPVFASPCVHGDEVEALPAHAVVLAANAVSDVQAVDISHEGGTFWGIQYHPEFSLNELSVILRRYKPTLMSEGFFRDPAVLDRWLEDLEALVADSRRTDIAWRYGIGPDILDPAVRLREIENFVEHRVKAVRAARGRG
ncbi:type 1 glutamine amidotransferase [Labrys wisconsinensis]|uniref:GMP synthase (Glutamine-hydrolyzing) n=1 Tax=Labrys wisconsinensis TaxID=425677 RepID=A0ABU0JAC9_9HYPH|nr:type 1 glutamine amidotransferase [Labrys wisconsinensis]MDQ0471222.1 GMP synthase (glutamine-hydrolyzing) [Labrys wisconsinensis]